MKTLNQICLLFALTLLAAPAALSKEGNEGSGGGNGTRSKPEDVIAILDGGDTWLIGPGGKRHKVVQQAHSLLSDIYEGLHENFTVPIRDPRMAPMLQKIVQSDVLQWDRNYGLRTFLDMSRVQIEKNLGSACMDAGVERDASVRIENTRLGPIAHICMSVPRLTRFPKDVLESQIAALVLHEMAHVAGLGESDAISIQEYGLRMLTEKCRIEIVLGGDESKPWHYSNFEIQVGSYLNAKVTFKQCHFPQHGNPGDCNFTKAETLQEKEDFRLDWSPSTGGSLRFISLNYDGSYNQESVEWEKTKDGASGWFGKAFESDGEVRARLRANGKQLTVKSVYIYPACAR